MRIHEIKTALAIMLVLLSGNALSQDSTSITYSFVADTVELGRAPTLSNRLQFTNHTNDSIIVYKTHATKTSHLIELPAVVGIGPGKEVFVPVKLLVTPSTIKDTRKIYEAAYKAQGRYTITTYSQFYISSEHRRSQLSMTMVESEIWVNNRNQIAPIRIRLTNKGFESANVELRATSYPEGLRFPEPIRFFNIGAGETQIITYHPENVSRSRFTPDYTVNLVALDDGGGVIGTGVVKVISLSDMKKMELVNSPLYEYSRNYVDVTAFANTNFLSYIVRSAGTYELADSSTVKYNLGLFYHNDNPQYKFDLMGTYVDYQRDKFGITAGNIYENLDYVLFGRGVKGTLRATEKDEVDIYYVNNSYSLFTDNPNQRNQSNIVAARYRYDDKDKYRNTVTNVFADNPYTAIKSNIISNRFEYLINNQSSLAVTGGYSIELPQFGGVENSHGYAGGLEYRKKTPKWEIASDNYISSPYYGGMRRGVMQFNERVGYQVGKGKQIYARVFRSTYAPEYLAETMRLSSIFNDNGQYELGYGFYYKTLFANVRAYAFEQNLNRFDNLTSAGSMARSMSYRLAASARMQYESNTMALNLDIGQATYETMLRGSGSLVSARLQASYYRKIFGISVLAQRGPYFISESIGSDPENFQFYSIGPSVRLVDKKSGVYGALSAYANYNAMLDGWSVVGHGSVNYDFRKKWSFHSDLTYNRMVFAKTFTVRVGITRHFLTRRNFGNNVNIRVFGDRNGNGVKDKEESYLENMILDMSGTVLSTNAKGFATAGNVPDKNQTITLLEGKGWYLPSPVIVKGRYSKSSPAVLPLVRSGFLKGQIKILGSKYDKTSFDKEGIRLVVKDTLGNEYKTYSDPFGSFSISLPVGSYSVDVEPIQNNFKSTGRKIEVVIEENKTKTIELEILDVKRIIDIKRF